LCLCGFIIRNIMRMPMCDGIVGISIGAYIGTAAYVPSPPRDWD